MKEKIEKEYGECMQELYSKIEINSSYWINYHTLNPGRFWTILRQRCRLMRYTLEYESELDDLMQSAVEKVLEQFQKEKVIPFQYRHTIFSLCCQNAINQHIRSLNLFKGLPAMGMPSEEEMKKRREEKKKDYFAGDGERVMITSTDYLSVDLKIDISLALTKEENKIVKMLLLKYKKTEIAKTLKIDERTIYKKLVRIKKKLEAAGLKGYAC